MRPLSPAERRRKAIARAKRTVSGCPGHGDPQHAIHRRDCFVVLNEASKYRDMHRERFGLLPRLAPSWAAAARALLKSARLHDALARANGWHLPEVTA